MAEIAKFKSSAAKAVFTHANRTANDGHKHSNESIDLERTKFNYRLKSGSVKAWRDRVNAVFHYGRNTANTLAECIVTLPAEVKEEDERAFFQSCYDFFADDFGEENIIYATVHKDEVTPHLHLGFVPVVKGEFDYDSAAGKNKIAEWMREHDGQRPTERICCKELIDRTYLKSFHSRLQKYADKQMGYHVGILNGATVGGNKSVLELKVKTLEEHKERLEQSLDSLQSDAQSVRKSLSKTGISPNDFGLYPLLQKIEDLQAENAALRNIIMRNGMTYKPSDFPKREVVPAKSVSVSICEGSLTDAEIPEDAVIVIEIPKHKDSPQKKLIDDNFDLRQAIQMAKAISEPVKVKKSRSSKQTYILIKTDDNIQDTMNSLLLMEAALREIEHIHDKEVYMDRMESDKYDLARSILTTNEITARYYTAKAVIDKSQADKEREQETVKE